ncbi:MAG: hypothetical protein ACRC3J_05240 [Culicoidibacterales bacterium]
MKKTILVDVDGVLVEWFSQLPFFMSEENISSDVLLSRQNGKWLSPRDMFGVESKESIALVKKYNKSEHIRRLAAYPDAIHHVNILSKEYNFVAISALGTTAACYANRTYNLKALFPNFGEIMLCDVFGDKRELIKKAAAKYDVLMYIDDRETHCEEAEEILGIRKVIHMQRTPILSTRFKSARDWDDIKKYIDNIKHGMVL